MLATMTNAMGGVKGSNKKNARGHGSNIDQFNITNIGGHFNFQNKNGMGPNPKINSKAITKANFYT